MKCQRRHRRFLPQFLVDDPIFGQDGLGLFIVRQIVRAHGGTIDVRSCDDLTTFAITLPRTAPPS
jgi:signal transduction histidine kinase